MIRMRALFAAVVLVGCGSPTKPVEPAPPVDPTPTAPPTTPPAPAAPHAEIGAWGFDKGGMDTSVDPATSFYNYANGTWAKNTPIPEDKAEYGMFGALQDKSEARTKEILETAKGATPDEQKIGDFYHSFMDEKAIEDKGFEPLKPLLAEIDAIKTKADVIKMLAKFQRGEVGGPFRISVGVDDRDPEHYMVNLSQAGLGLPDRDMYDGKKPQFAKVREAYKKYIAEMLGLIGVKDADKKAVAIYALEDKIAAVHWTRKERRNPTAMYNKMTQAEIAKLAPGFDWKLYLEGCGVGAEKFVDVNEKSAIAGEAKVFAATSVDAWKDYLTMRLVADAAAVLPKKFVDTQFDMFGKTLRGVPQLKERWKRGVDFTSAALGEAIGKVYVGKWFTPETKAAADRLVGNLLAAMGKRLDTLAWMSDATKAKAKAKLAAYNPKIGYPKKWRDYSKLDIVAGDAYGNAWRASEFNYNRNLAHLGQPIDRDEWGMTPMTVNAYYSPDKNEIVFPAAILQPPFFDPNADDAVNYGGIGAVIGHEISHGFDDQGRQYDGTGKLDDWWTKEDAAKFKVGADKLVAQYSAYCPFPAHENKPAQCVDGGLTLGENIADLAGLTIAYDAYKLSLGGKDAPALDGITGGQRFFLGWAQVWRRSYREAELSQRLTTDPHSPSEYRAAVVRNLDAWYEAFKPEVGKGLALKPDDRVKIW